MNFLRSRKQFQHMDIWIRDCCPQSLDEIIGNEEIKNILSKYLEADHLPNILLTGSHGTCKRTFAKLLAKNYLGDDFAKGCLSIDGAVYRGKDVISTNMVKKPSSDSGTPSGPNVLEFTKIKVSLGGKTKIIIIYNFEDMTPEAQNALRRIMELHSDTTRFILICNDLDNIIEAIQSRCVPLCTQLLTTEETDKLIDHLLTSKGLPQLPDDVRRIINILSDGDMKKVINYTQTIAASGDISITGFHNIFNVPPVRLLEQMLIYTQDVQTQPKALEKVTFLLDQGYNYGDILEMLTKVLAHSDCIPEELRMLYLKELSVYYCEMTPHTMSIHLYALFSKFAQITAERKTRVAY